MSQSSPVTVMDLPRIFQEFLGSRITLQQRNGFKVVSLMHRPSLSPGNALGTYFC